MNNVFHRVCVWFVLFEARLSERDSFAFRKIAETADPRFQFREIFVGPINKVFSDSAK